MEQKTATMSDDGTIALPTAYREALGLRGGDAVILLLEGGEVRIVPSDAGIRHAQEIVRRYVPEGRSLVDELIADRKAEARDA